MLYKNGEPYKLDANEIKAIRTYFHNKFPVKVTYPPERIVKSRSKHNRLPDKPNSISFDFKAVVNTTKGTEEWRYVENITTDNKGNKHYFPKKFKFKGSVFLKETDIEKIFFLLRKSEYCKGGDNEGRITKFMFEDLVSEAEKKAERKAQATKINNLLFGEAGMGLPIEKLKELAKAMFLRGVDSLSDSQVRVALDSRINDTKDGVDRFLSLIDADKEIKTRAMIQNVIDTGKLVYDPPKKGWYWKIDGERPQHACRVSPGENAQEALVQEYMINKDFRQDVNTILLTGRKSVGSDKDTDNDDDVE